MHPMRRFSYLIVTVVALSGGALACKDDDPNEPDIDKTTGEEVEDTAEEAGRDIDETADEVGDEVDDEL